MAWTKLTITRNGIPVPNAQIVFGTLYTEAKVCNEDGEFNANLAEGYIITTDIYVIDPSDGAHIRSHVTFENGGTYIIDIPY